MKVSIITATYNSAATVRDTLESVLAQSYPDIEHIIVDGNSKDDTVAVCREYEERYRGRLRIVSEPDKGIYDAMNKGIAMASGEIVGILNSDDFFSSSTVVEEIAADFMRYGVDAVYGDIHFVESTDLHTPTRYYSSRFFRPWMMRLGYQPAHPSFYCRRECYQKYGMFDISLKVAADFENMLRLIFINGIRIKYVPRDCVTMRTGGASTSGLRSHATILSEHFRAYRKNGVVSGLFCDVWRYPLKVGELLLQKVCPGLFLPRR